MNSPEFFPTLSPEQIKVADYDLVITDSSILLSADEAFVVDIYLRGLESDSPYTDIRDTIHGQRKAFWPTDKQIELRSDQSLQLAATYVGLAWISDITDRDTAQKLRYKIDKLLPLLTEEEQKFIKDQLFDLNQLFQDKIM
jgi:hypothetical protein